MKKSTSLLIQDEDSQYLLIQRSKTCNNLKEWWEFPGGKLEGDEQFARVGAWHQGRSLAHPPIPSAAATAKGLFTGPITRKDTLTIAFSRTTRSCATPEGIAAQGSLRPPGAVANERSYQNNVAALAVSLMDVCDLMWYHFT
jgi:hypothetical protein